MPGIDGPVCQAADSLKAELSGWGVRARPFRQRFGKGVRRLPVLRVIGPLTHP